MKFQNPNLKRQTPDVRSDSWSLGIGHSLELATWSLEFPATPPATMNDLTSFQPRTRPARRDARRGVILLFVVVLLTLLAVMGSAYLITSRIDAGQINPDSRGGDAENFGPTAASRLDQVMAEAQEAAQRKLFLDLFAFNGTPVPQGGAAPANPSGARYVVDPDNDPTTASADQLLWRAAQGAAAGYLPVEPVFNPMRTYGGGTAAADGTIAAEDVLRFPYYHIDAEGGTDTHLASRLPWFNNLPTSSGAPLNQFVWPWVSGPLVGLPAFPVDHAFVNPFGGTPAAFFSVDFGADGDAARSNLIPTTFGPVPYNSPAEVEALTGSDEFYNDRLRVFPAFDADGDGTPDMFAADADGDGVADSGLSPIVFDASVDPSSGAFLDRYTDPQTGHMYLVGVRIVDNNAAVNANTALTNFGDIALTAAAQDYADMSLEIAANYTLPNWGISPSNIGLYQLFFQGTDADAPGDPGYGIDDNGNGATRAYQFLTFLPTLMGNGQSLRVTTTSGRFDPADNSEVRDDMEFGSLGELLGQNNARRLENPFSAGADAAGDYQFMAPFRGTTDAQALAFKGGGWIRPGKGSTGLENLFLDSFRIAAGNYVPDRKLQFESFPIGPDVGAGESAGESQYELRGIWAALFNTADPDKTSLDAFRTYHGMPLGPRFGDTVTLGDDPNFALSPRTGIVTKNGVSQAFQPNLLMPGGSVLLTDPDQVPGQVDSDGDGTIDAGMPSYAPDDSDLAARPPVKANVNTAQFNELWRAYWNVMVAESPTTTGNALGFDAPIAPTAGVPDAFNPGTTATSTEVGINDHNGVADLALTREQVLLLRSAIAAVNAMDLRDVDRVYTDAAGTNPAPAGTIEGAPDRGDNDITVAEIALGAGGGPPYARVYGTEAQPFIDEVLFYTSDGAVIDFLGVELVNPHPFPLDVSGWKLVAVTRGTAPATLTDIAVLPAGTLIPPAQYTGATTDAPGILYIDNGGAATAGEVAPTETVTDETNPGPGEILVDSGTSMTAPDALIDATTYAELLLVRPVRNDLAAAGTPPASFGPEDFVPIDGVDFRGPTPAAGQEFHYARPTGAATALPPMRDWDYTIAGTWTVAGGPEGTNSGEVIDVSGDPAADASFGAVNSEPGTYTAPHPVAPLGPVVSGPWKASDSPDPSGTNYTQPTYPYGGFARDGDIMAVPFVGSYRLDDDTGNYDWVPVTLDMAFADANEAGNTAPGRFYPFTRRTGGGSAQDWWAEDLLEYLTAAPSPGSDTFPNVDPRYAFYLDDSGDWRLYSDETLNARGSADADWDRTVSPPPEVTLADFSGSPDPVAAPDVWQFAGFVDADDDGISETALAPGLIDNDGDGFANGYDVDTDVFEDYETLLEEALLPVEGLINLHTASEGILKTLPFVVDASGNVLPGTGAGSNSNDASRLYAERFDAATGAPRGPYIADTTAGTVYPFTSLFQLPMIEDPTGGDTSFNDPILTDDQPAAGDISGRIDPDGSVLDDTANFYDAVEGYEEETLQATRLSNLVTTRSDSYTVYIVVQAWEVPGDTADGNHAGGLPELIRQERSAFTVDRSGVSPFRPRELWADPDVPEPWTAADVNGEAWKEAFEDKIMPVPVE